MLPPDNVECETINATHGKQVDDKHIKTIHLHPPISGSNGNASGNVAGGKSSHRSKTHALNNLLHDKYDTNGQLTHSHARVGVPSMTSSDRNRGELF